MGTQLARTQVEGGAEIETLDRMIGGPVKAGLGVIAVFAGVFVVWGGSAPLAGGAVAPGAIAPDGKVRTIQHLEGGIVAEIYVRDGDTVAAGAALLALQETAPAADVGTLRDRLRARLAERSRLEAEIVGASRMAFPDELEVDPAANGVIEAERRIFEAREEMLNARRLVLGQRIEQLNEQIVGLDAQVASTSEQLLLIEEEIADRETLLAKGLSPKSELLRLRRAAAEIRGHRGEYMAGIARARQQIGESEIELVALDAERIDTASSRLAALRGEIAEIRQQLAASEDVLARTIIEAPVSGIVSDLQVTTKGGVVRAGDPILDIVPTDERMVIDVQVAPLDIDVVDVGMEALVHLSALPNRRAPQIHGQVTAVSADRLVDPNSGSPHYWARVEVDAAELSALGDVDLKVGMPAEVIIVNRSRTMLGYLVEPLLEAARRAGREV